MSTATTNSFRSDDRNYFGDNKAIQATEILHLREIRVLNRLALVDNIELPRRVNTKKIQFARRKELFSCVLGTDVPLFYIVHPERKCRFTLALHKLHLSIGEKERQESQRCAQSFL